MAAMLRMEDGAAEVGAAGVPVDLVDHALADDGAIRSDEQQIQAILVAYAGVKEGHNLLAGEIGPTTRQTRDLGIERAEVVLIVGVGIRMVSRAQQIAVMGK